VTCACWVPGTWEDLRYMLGEWPMPPSVSATPSHRLSSPRLGSLMCPAPGPHPQDVPHPGDSGGARER
jgi:hypothetical protein